MPNLTNSEAIAFNEDLDRYQAQEVAADKRDAWVETRVKDLLQDDYSPHNPANIVEAINELNFPDACMLGAYCSAAAKHPENQIAQTHLADFFLRVCREYWESMAKSTAQDEYDKGGW